ncbi:multidrug efflux RND transporter permease subunit [Azoarcus sp. TTM-91]|uniref:multidrug efflux RND transporter permease subunit n=1 Tax=Azoarcus sp. TTM-91 TaxID=2691581 RepID=UPI00145F8A70|nr:multidrug efflux RND transporter permease subunit [Azoarcus sp. TTM-91]NMG36596.1 multidrug efflux RND transporter permease subunit [Azoarcus sp. TTM-91]
MNISTPFVRRPVATVLLTLALVLAGWLSYRLLPVAPLPQVDFPTIVVSASLPGASPETMASSVATPLERALGRIAGITEMSSSSSQGSTSVMLQFALEKNIDTAAREVQAAINAAMSMLPSGMPSNPTYRKMNPSDMPVMVLTLTSDKHPQSELYDLASNTVARKLAQVKGVGQVSVGGSSLPAVRVALNPDALAHYGLALDDVRSAIDAANANTPKGTLERGEQSWQVDANDRIRKAADYAPLIVRHQDGAVVRLRDVARVTDGVENTRNVGFHNDKRAILLLVSRQAGANIIETTDGVRAAVPALQAALGDEVALTVVEDRSPSVRASLHEAEFTLVISIGLVILVVFLFLRNGRATLIPSLAVPISLIGTFAVMYLAGFSLNNLSLMALIIATGFVVDDAIVVVEHIASRIEDGEPPFQAALAGARDVGFTVVSMSLSLVAVFIPILLMGGVMGRLFREFSVTLSAAILVSMVVSLTLTPMMCARLLKPLKHKPDAVADDAADRFIGRFMLRYRASLAWALTHSPLMMLILLATVGLNVYLYTVVPKGFFPEQDSGRLMGFAIADQGISFPALQEKLESYRRILMADPAVKHVMGFSGGSRGPGASTNTGQFIVILKDLSEREPVNLVLTRLRMQLGNVPGANMFLVNMQDLRIGARSGNATYQLTLKSDDLDALRAWAPRVEAAMRDVSQITDVNSDSQAKAIQVYINIDRDAARRLGIDVQTVTAVLNNSYTQRQVSTIYEAQNQYHVVLVVADAYRQSADALRSLQVVTSAGERVPLSSIASVSYNNAPLQVNHDGQFASTTVSFSLPDGVTLEQGQQAIREALRTVNLPLNVQAGFAGTAGELQKVVAQQPLLILAALVAVYIVLGMLYESYIHPLTILSTLPSAGVGALLALMACKTELSLIALIGIILLIGIVKKNAILMIDFALDAERRLGMAPREAILDAGVKRFRPIMMTTLAALLGALPLLLGTGGDAPLRRPLGIAIVGGLAVSQLLTLYTTPVVYLYLDRLRHWTNRRRGVTTDAPLEHL